MCPSVVEGPKTQCLAPRCDLLHMHLITLSKKSWTCRWNGPAAGYTGGYNVLQGPNLGFPCSYVLYKPKQMKKYIVGTSCGESYRGKPPGPPRLGFRWRKTVGAPESHKNLHMDVEYVSKCGGRSIDAMSSSPV